MLTRRLMGARAARWIRAADSARKVSNVTDCTLRTMATERRCLSMGDVNPYLKAIEYAVRGPIAIRAIEIEHELLQGITKPFNEVIQANIGDCHAMGQVPITFIRQVLALIAYPEILLKNPHFPEDVKDKARAILGGCRGGSVGSYSEIPGIELIRHHVAEYIHRRDGIACDWKNVILTSGASNAIKSVLRLLNCQVQGKQPGILVPVPQYPLYSATLAEFNMAQINYNLDESNNWSLDISELDRAISEGRKSTNPRAIVIINPGNPTGQVLSKENIQNIIKFAYKEKLFIFADEVYQDNVYAEGSQFHSFKKVLMELGPPYSNLELASFMSCSKGYMGECGLRGGYVELINICPEVRAIFHKAISAMLCPSVPGQAVMDCIVAPPKEGELSYELYAKEKAKILKSLGYRAKLVTDTFNSFEGFQCNPVQGAMYAFPQIKLPPKAIAAAREKGMPADTFYAFQLLEKSGICVVPGSGFGQKPGTYHFRTTILPQTEKLKEMLHKFSTFHEEFVHTYR